MEDVNLLNVLVPSSELTVAASNSLHTQRLSIPHIQAPVQYVASTSSSFMDPPTRDCAVTHLSLNQLALTFHTLSPSCDFKTKLLAEVKDNKNVNTLEKTQCPHNGIKYSSRDDNKTDYLCLSLPNSKATKLHQDSYLLCSLPSPGYDSMQNPPDYNSSSKVVEMSSSKSLVAANSSSAIHGQAPAPHRTIIHSQLMPATTINTTTTSDADVYYSLTASATLPLLNLPNSAIFEVDAPGNGTFSTSVPSKAAFGETPASDSSSSQGLSQSYASLTPWTSKLTSSDYIPLPKPGPDSLPIPLENCIQSALPPTQDVYAKSRDVHTLSQDVYAASYYNHPMKVYSYMKPGLMFGCSSETISSNRTIGEILLSQSTGLKVVHNREHRFRRTAEALHKSGLWEVAMKTGSLIKRNRELQKELEEFRSDAIIFLKSVIKNPQNRDFIKSVLTTALTLNSSTRTRSSVMSVVVSAAATAAASLSVRLDPVGSSNSSTSENSSA